MDLRYAEAPLQGGAMAKLIWHLKPVAELESGVISKTEVRGSSQRIWPRLRPSA